MDQPNLPRHVVERVERRWAAVLSYQAALRPECDRVGVKDPSPDLAKQTLEQGVPSQCPGGQSGTVCSDWTAESAPLIGKDRGT